MVGSELPSPETRESTVTDREVLRRRGPGAGRARAAAGRCSPAWTWWCTPARCSASPASRATGRPSWSRRSWGCAGPSGGADRAGAARTSPARSTLQRREAGIGYVPEDRTRHGLLLTQPLWANRILGYQSRPPVSTGGLLGLLDRAAARRDTERIVAEFDVRTPGVEVPAAALSGGNQQKLVVGRELSGDPVLLIAVAPDPRGGRRRAGRDLGGAAPGPGPRAGRAADQRRPGRADRAVGLDQGDAARAAGRRRRPGHGHARGAGRGDDRCRRGRADTTTRGRTDGAQDKGAAS